VPAGVSLFDPAISRDDPWPSKPDPESLIHIPKKWGVLAGPELMMVGDSAKNDVAYGKAAGVRTALLDTGRRLAEGGESGNADFIVQNLAWLAALAWRDFNISSPLTDPALHAKREAPLPVGEAAVAAAAGDISSLEDMGREALSKADAIGQTPLIWAADTGRLAAVQFLLEAGVEINSQGYLGATAVSRAARRGHTSVLTVVLEHGANPQIPNNNLQFPLHFAAFKLKPEAVQVLLNYGANPLVLDRKGRTPAEDTNDEAIRSSIQAAQRRFIDAKLTEP